MKTLHELATKLQEFIIKQQNDAHNQTNVIVTRYNNLKLRIDTKIHYPHVIVRIGISEAVFNIAEGTKTDGGLGPDEKYVRKWLSSSNIILELKEIYIAMNDFIKAEDEKKSMAMEGESDEAKMDPIKKGSLHFRNETDEVAEDEQRITVEEAFEQMRQDKDIEEDAKETVTNLQDNLRNYIKSMFNKNE